MIDRVLLKASEGHVCEGYQRNGTKKLVRYIIMSLNN